MIFEFGLFNISHIIVIVLTLVLSLLCFVLKNNTFKFYGYVCLSILVITTIAFNVYHISRDSFVVSRYLPFHLCNLSVYILLLSFFVKRQWTQIVLYVSPVSALLAIVLPDMGKGDGFPSFRFMEFFISHMMIVALCVWLVVDNRYNLKYRFLWIAYGLLFVWMILMKFVNDYLGSNYLYISYKPSNAKAIFNLLGPDNNYLIGLCLLVLTVFHIEFAIVRLIKFVSKK